VEGGQRVAWPQNQPMIIHQTRNHDTVIKAHLSVYPSLKFFVIYKTTFLPEGSFDWGTGPFFIPPTAEPTG
jgi:hypothetical protein